MLAPEDRRLLLDSLRPPAGYQLGHAVGTTFSLDLLALLTAPLAFTFFDWENAKGETTSDPLALLEAIRRNCDRITLFCQADRIKVPATHARLYAYLEAAVHPVVARSKGGIFHPKVWLLRFVPDDAGEPVKYRLLCMSRNLTFDRSWDTVLVLEGTLTERKNAIRTSRDVGNFIAGLPGLCLQNLSPERKAELDTLAEEVKRVEFEPPEGFEALEFWPMGMKGRYTWPFENNRRRMLVISPFATEKMLHELCDSRRDCFLVTQQETAAELSEEARSLFEQVYVLAQDTDPSAVDQSDDPQRPTEEESAVEANNPESLEDTLHGLHAKLFVIDDGHKGRVFTGSANATNAAFERNVEFVVELVGRKSVCGIDAMMMPAKGTSSFHNLLVPFDAPAPREAGEAEKDPFEAALNEARLTLAAGSLAARIEGKGGDLGYSLTLQWAVPPDGALPEGGSCTVRPVTLQTGHAKPLVLSDKEPMKFVGVSVEALTAFFAVAVTLERGQKKKMVQFLLKADVTGFPRRRFEHLLRSLLGDRQKVMRLLLLLLAGEGFSVADLADLGEDATAAKRNGGRAGTGEVPLLEALLRALQHDPAKLQQIHHLVEDLNSSDETRELLPEGFDAIWPAIWTAAQAGKP